MLDRTPARCRLWKGDLTWTRRRCQAAKAAKRDAVMQLTRERRRHAADERRWRREERDLRTSLDDASRQVAELRHVLEQVFSERQVTRLRTGRQERWSEEDIVKALSLRCISRKCYRYLREKLNFPLPGITTLQEWTRGFRTPPGLLQMSLKAMSSVRDTLTDMERVVVLSFDEMAVNGRICYDSGEDRVYGSHKDVQVTWVDNCRNTRGYFPTGCRSVQRVMINLKGLCHLFSKLLAKS